MSIVTWEYYDSLHNNCGSEEFPKLEALAEQRVREVIGLAHWSEITPDTFGYEALQDCICNVIDKMISDANSGRGKGLSSVSNDGYSETYAIKDEADLRNEMASNIRAWLSGTGLVRAY